MVWLVAPAAKAAQIAVKCVDGPKLRTVLCTPLRDPLRDPLRAAARGILSHRGPWAVSVGGARRGTRTIVGYAGASGSRPGRYLMASQWMAQEGLHMNLLLARAAARRAQLRFVTWLGGLSVGVGAVCLSVSLLDHLHSEAMSRSHLDGAALTRAPSGPVLDVLARNLVRKNSRLAIGEAYTFASDPPLGVGSFGIVHRATQNTTGLERAVKCIDKQGLPDVTMLLREVEALRIMDHPSICRLIEYFETDRHLWLVMELCRGEELCDRVLRLPSGLPEPEASRLMAQMLRATLHCHRRSVLHRDLKPENFLFKDKAPGRQGDFLKLVDFGFCMTMPVASSSFLSSPSKESLLATFPSSLLSSGRASESGGTLLYRSPESFQGASPSCSDDAWSLGVIFHILLTGQFPFSTNDDARFQELCSCGLLQRDVEEHLNALPMSVSQNAADLATRLLAVDPAKRISLESALHHPYITAESNEISSPLTHQWQSPKDFYNRCERFRRSPRLRRIALAAAARLLVDDALGKEHMDSARATFLALDKHGNGRINTSDLREFFLASGGFMPPSAWFSSLATGWPALAEPTGIGYSAFVAITLDDLLTTGDNRLCRTIFDLLDASRDGTVCPNDLQIRLGISSQEAEQVVNESLGQLADSSIDGAIGQRSLTFPAFLSLMRTKPSLVEPCAATKREAAVLVPSMGSILAPVGLMVC